MGYGQVDLDWRREVGRKPSEVLASGAFFTKDVNILSLSEIIPLESATIKGEVGLEDTVLGCGCSCLKRDTQNIWLVRRRKAHILGNLCSNLKFLVMLL